MPDCSNSFFWGGRGDPRKLAVPSHWLDFYNSYSSTELCYDREVKFAYSRGVNVALTLCCKLISIYIDYVVYYCSIKPTFMASDAYAWKTIFFGKSTNGTQPDFATCSAVIQIQITMFEILGTLPFKYGAKNLLFRAWSPTKSGVKKTVESKTGKCRVKNIFFSICVIYACF